MRFEYAGFAEDRFFFAVGWEEIREPLVRSGLVSIRDGDWYWKEALPSFLRRGALDLPPNVQDQS